MKELNNYLNTFHPIIDDLKALSPVSDNGSSNVVLGGSLILKIHGLNFSRKSEDLDVIINFPTPKQNEYIKAISNFSENNSEYWGKDNLKFSKNNLYINVLINNTVEVNDFFLQYKWGNKLYDINSVSEIIKAKSLYGRVKDFKDMILLKNENFNL